MGGQVLGGGVIVLVCALLWLVYLVPSWASRYRYDAAERNALRMSRALRALAETSEVPEEVQLELNTRTAYAQQRAARRLQAERDATQRRLRAQQEAAERRLRAEQEAADKRALAEKTQLERERVREAAELERVRLREASELERERAREAEALERVRLREAAELDRARLREAEAAERARLELARRELGVVGAGAAGDARRAQARRRARLLATTVLLIALVLIGFGVWSAVTAGSYVLLAAGAVVAVLWFALAHRINTVSRTAVVPVAIAAARARAAVDITDFAVGEDREWAPRSLPRPLTASVGSHAAAVLDAADAREALRRAAVEETLRERAEPARPPSIAAHRAAAPDAGGSDAEIEAHVRDLLARRAVGQ